MQLILTGILFLVFAIGMLIFYNKRKNEKADEIHYVTLTMPYLLDTVKKRVVEITRADEVISATNAAYRVRQANKERLEVALTQCIDGIKSAREITIALIRDIIKVELETEEDCCKIKDFKSMEYLSPMDKFEILYYCLERDHGDDVINYLEDKYELTKLREITTDAGQTKLKREFGAELIDEIFAVEVLDAIALGMPFGYDEELDVLARLLFAQYKGLGPIDTLRQAKIDGFNYGTSGSTRYEIEGRWDATYKATNSVWVQINAMWVHFSFIDFYTMNEMRRITRQLTSYGNLAPMTEKLPVKVTEAPDGSRITAFGPPVGEWWACFVRKFNLSIYTMKSLLDKPYAKNSELPIQLLYFLAKARFNLPVTGQQNTGKTTFMKSLIELYDLMNIRVMEMSFELALREIYPWMNIFTAKPTQYVDNAKVQDTFKKSDGALSMVGEVAENNVIPNMIQFARVASQATMFSSHHKTDYDLIYGLADGWMECTNIERDAAISAILDVLNLNVHMDFESHNRVLAYVSEIIKENELQPYPTIGMPKNVTEAIYQQTVIDREYYTRSTDRVRMTSRKIVVYDAETQSYKANDWFTDETIKKMMNNLGPEDREAFIQFADENFMEVRKWRKAQDKKAAEMAGKTVTGQARKAGGH